MVVLCLSFVVLCYCAVVDDIASNIIHRQNTKKKKRTPSTKRREMIKSGEKKRKKQLDPNDTSNVHTNRCRHLDCYCSEIEFTTNFDVAVALSFHFTLFVVSQTLKISFSLVSLWSFHSFSAQLVHTVISFVRTQTKIKKKKRFFFFVHLSIVFVLFLFLSSSVCSTTTKETFLNSILTVRQIIGHWKRTEKIWRVFAAIDRLIVHAVTRWQH